ncbi:membrane anchor subunit of succinate dehydrogenase, Sdh4 [Malassezia sp. CBS 17886]|nr:membrane anchor subunit of succinate dehydrogenase, Sdh4 [Malassezia sp. CBS 17886]
MSMRAVVGLNKSMLNQGSLRALAARNTTESDLTARPAALAVTKPRAFGGPMIHPSGSYIQGTVNDPTPFPPPDKMKGSYHWDFERVICVAFVPLIVATGAKHGVSGAFDAGLSMVFILHSYLGFECMLTDYVHKRKFPIAAPISLWLVRGLTVATAYGLYEFNTNDIGITALVAKLWTA